MTAPGGAVSLSPPSRERERAVGEATVDPPLPDSRGSAARASRRASERYDRPRSHQPHLPAVL